jgi:transcription antitermination factor NusG
MKLKIALAATFALSIGAAVGILHGCSLLGNATKPKEIHAVVVPVEKPAPLDFRVGDKVKVHVSLFHDAVGVIVEKSPLGFGECSVLFVTERGEATRISAVPVSVLTHND